MVKLATGASKPRPDSRNRSTSTLVAKRPDAKNPNRLSTIAIVTCPVHALRHCGKRSQFVAVMPGQRAVAKVIWDKRRNPTNYVSDSLGIEMWQLRGAIHKIKARANLGAQDRITIYDDGTVKDESGEDVGNIYDEI